MKPFHAQRYYGQPIPESETLYYVHAGSPVLVMKLLPPDPLLGLALSTANVSMEDRRRFLQKHGQNLLLAIDLNTLEAP